MDQVPSATEADQMAREEALVLRNLAFLRLQRQYPNMKTAARDRLLDKIETHCEDFIAQEAGRQQTKARTNFFSLSAELRNSIYELALAGLGHRISNSYVHKRPGLLSASKQVRKEVLPMYYAIPIHGDVCVNRPLYPSRVSSYSRRRAPLGRIDAYLDAIGPEQARMIKTFKLEFLFLGGAGTELGTLISDGDLKNEHVIQQVLEAFNLLDKGVPLEAWRLNRQISWMEDYDSGLFEAYGVSL